MADQRRGELLRVVHTLFNLGAAGGLTDGELLGRFIDRHGEAAEGAFSALVERHGPMVLRVCRSILRSEHDAQDAFQATFLILVRRARSVHKRDSLASWLYGVALRVAACAKTTAARRRAHERTATMLTTRSNTDADETDVVPILHEEVGRLPERYRSAVVLCYLEGQTCAQAARQLGCPVGTVKSRLARGRELLRSRLARRGSVFSVGMLFARLSPKVHPVALPAALAEATVRVAVQSATGGVALGAIPESVILIMRDVRGATMISTMQKPVGLVLLGIFACATAFAYQGAGSPSQSSPPNVAKGDRAVSPAQVGPSGPEAPARGGGIRGLQKAEELPLEYSQAREYRATVDLLEMEVAQDKARLRMMADLVKTLESQIVRQEARHPVIQRSLSREELQEKIRGTKEEFTSLRARLVEKLKKLGEARRSQAVWELRVAKSEIEYVKEFEKMGSEQEWPVDYEGTKHTPGK